jgi:multidrug efflux pump subunit AcrB
MVITVNPPSIQGLGQRAGFEYQLEAKAHQDIRELWRMCDQLLSQRPERPEIVGLNSTLRVIQPQLLWIWTATGARRRA